MGPSLNPKSNRACTAHSVKYIKRRHKPSAPPSSRTEGGVSHESILCLIPDPDH